MDPIAESIPIPQGAKAVVTITADTGRVGSLGPVARLDRHSVNDHHHLAGATMPSRYGTDSALVGPDSKIFQITAGRDPE